VGGSWDGAWIWGIETGKLVAGLFQVEVRLRGDPHVTMVRFLPDLKKFVILSLTRHLVIGMKSLTRRNVNVIQQNRTEDTMMSMS